MTSLTGDPLSPRPLLGSRGWAWLVGLGGAFLLIHWTFLYNTSRIFFTDNSLVRANWSHIVAIPLIAGYYIYQKRERLRRTQPTTCWIGLPILFAGLFSYVWWIYPGRNDMFRGYSMVVSLFGLVLLLLGPKMMRVLWFPVLYMAFAVKVSDSLWERIANVLQDIAARGATLVLQLLAPVMDFDIVRDGNTIRMLGGNLADWYPMNVAEACSGLRMLMAFIALGVAMAFLFDRAWWQRLVMVAMAIPIALAVNIGRVTAIGVIALYDTEMAKGDFHTLIGMLMLIPAGLLFLGLGWVLDRILIEPEPGEGGAAPQKAPPLPPVGMDRDPEDPATRPRRVLRGGLVGVVLVLVMGLFYWLMIGYEPVNSLLMDAIQSLGIRLDLAMLAGAAVRVLLVAALVAGLIPLVRRFVGRGSRAAVFGLAGGLLGAWLITQVAVLQVQGAVIVKQPVPLRHELFMLPETVGPWRVIERDPPMSKEIEEALGTKKHLGWYFLDTRLASPKNVDVRRGIFPPGSVVRLHLAYYTGGIDTVPHVPDRCNVAGGFQALGNSYRVPISLDPDRYTYEPEAEVYQTSSRLEPRVRTSALDFHARAFTYAPPNRPDAAETVVYFFVANGKYFSSPNQVRLLGFDLRDKHAYHFKVQAEAIRVSDPDEAVARAQDLIVEILPEILATLPDWTQVQAGLYPAPIGEPTRTDTARDP